MYIKKEKERKKERKKWWYQEKYDAVACIPVPVCAGLCWSCLAVSATGVTHDVSTCIIVVIFVRKQVQEGDSQISPKKGAFRSG